VSHVYIAGPMTGLPEYNYPAFNAAAEALQAIGHRAINPACHDFAAELKPWDWYVREGLRMLLDAEAVALLPGWEQSKGATLEVTVANALRLDVRPVSEWLNGAA
jgi:hypothetical protein